MSGACATLLIGATANAAQKQTKIAPKRERVVLVFVTGSLIPQRVVLGGQQVNSASPVTVFRQDEFGRSSGTTVASILALDPSITMRRR